MIFQLVRKVKLLLNPIKAGQVFYGDTADFYFGVMEQALHGLRDLEGKEKQHYWHGPDTYRLTVVSTQMPYYRCDSDVLTRTVENGNFLWKARSLPRRMHKQRFHELIVEGKIKRIK